MVTTIESASPVLQPTSFWKWALAGDPHSRAQWKVDQGGNWVWQSDGVLVSSSGTEWVSISWLKCSSSILKGLKNFVVELKISGKAEAAGLSFGDFKDFLARLDSRDHCKHLQLEVDTSAGCWAFRVDGQLQGSCWWNSGVRRTDDIVDGILSLKARNVEQVLFHELAIHTFQSSCRLSVIITCNRFQQRLRVSLRNWCNQSAPSGAYEVLVVNPDSPDGTHELLAAMANCYPHVRIRELPVGSNLATNKGAMINHAFKASSGEWIWLTDADCLFSATSAASVLNQVEGQTACLFYGQRRYLTASQTDELIAGSIDGLKDFEALSLFPSTRTPDNAPWGYTQIVHRSTLERFPYRNGINHFAHSDDLFIQDCKRHGILPVKLSGLFCLHMDHPFTWYGTNMFL